MTKRPLDRKVCSLLVDGSINDGQGLSKYLVYRRRYEHLRKKNPQAIFTIERAFRNMIEDTRMLLDQ